MDKFFNWKVFNIVYVASDVFLQKIFIMFLTLYRIFCVCYFAITRFRYDFNLMRGVC